MLPSFSAKQWTRKDGVDLLRGWLDSAYDRSPDHPRIRDRSTAAWKYGRPGGGIMALRGHCTIQGSTDVPTQYDLMPGYLAQPIADEGHETIDGYSKLEWHEQGILVNTKKFSSA